MGKGKRNTILVLFLSMLFILFSVSGCPDDDDEDDSSSDSYPIDDDDNDDAADDDADDDDDNNGDDDDNDDSTEFADIQAVSVTGDPGEYILNVTIKSPDTGCDQYADWWEVLTDQGELIYRRILNHSHVDEQPFTRSGGPVDVQPENSLVVRAHMNELGYGGAAMKGTVQAGFESAPEIDSNFASGVENQDPQPEDCLF